MTMRMETGKVVVVGAGLMGRGIAHGFAASGFRTIMVDVSQSQLDAASAEIKQIIAGGVKLGKVSEEAARKANELLTTSTDLAGSAKGAELLLETAIEKMAIKLDIVRQAEEVLSDDAVIGTNTSALSITEIASVAKKPHRVVGMHYFNPVHKMKLLEIIKAIQTDERTVEGALAWGKAKGKQTIVVNESPGMATSRMSALAGNEAMYMLQEGVASAEDIDTGMRLAFNHPMGALELGDLVGWDTRLSILAYLHQVLGEKFRPCPLIIKMVKAGRLGRKVGHGVYKYDEKGQKIPGSGLKAR